MITTSQELPEQAQVSSVIMGRQDFLSVQLRLIAMELYKLRRRTLSKALMSVGIAIVVVILLAVGLSTWRDVSRAASDYAPPFCAADPQPGCVNHPPTLADKELYKEIQVKSNAQLLSLPGSLQLVYFITVNALVVLIIILMGAVAGGEYSLGTVRLLFTRGPTRLQFLVAKIGASVVCIAITILLFTVITLVLGAILYPLSGFPLDLNFLTISWVGQALEFLLLCMFYWFVYAMMALFFGTLGRSSVAGIVGPFLWIFIEEVLFRLIQLMHNMSGPLGDFAKALPGYFLGNCVATLVLDKGHVVYNGSTGLVSDLQAWLVVLAYLAIFVGLSSWLTLRRDVTN